MRTKLKKKRRNIALLRKVKAAILRYPDQFEMRGWFSDSLWIKGNWREPGRCGTAACIGGWAVHIAKKLRKLSETENILIATEEYAGELAREVLRLNSHDSRALFLAAKWPLKFYFDYAKARTPKERAKVAAKRIDHFIEHGD